MITFKQFISEAPKESRPQISPLTLENSVKFALEHCKDALWMFEKKMPLYRGMENFGACGHVDTTATERVSQNTSNHYTVLLDNNPYMHGYPKRSRSFIGTTSRTYVGGFSRTGGAIYAMIPCDGVKIGVVNEVDLWDVSVTVFRTAEAIEDMNQRFRRIPGLDKKDPTIQDFKWVDKRLKDHDDHVVQRTFMNFPGMTEEDLDDFLDTVYKSYSPSALGFELETTKTLKSNFNHNTEVWVGGEVLLIADSNFNNFCKLVLEAQQ